MSNPRCDCGARAGTVHATNCTVYRDNAWKRIAELEAQVERLNGDLDNLVETVLAIQEYDMGRKRPSGWQCDLPLFVLMDNAFKAAYRIKYIKALEGE